MALSRSSTVAVREDKPFFVKSKAKQTTTKITTSVTCTWLASKGGIVVIYRDSGKLALGQREDATGCICFCPGIFQGAPTPLISAVGFSQGPERRLQHMVLSLRSSQMVSFVFWVKVECTWHVKGN